MSFMCKIEVGPKREECKKGGWCTGCQKFFEVGPRREKCEKGVGAKRVGAKQFRTWVRKKFWALEQNNPYTSMDESALQIIKF